MGAIGDSKICRWEMNKKAAFSIVFDDGCPTQLDVAIPELRKRDLTAATFFLNPGKRHFTARVAEWVNVVKMGFDFANHTMNHTGATDYKGCDYEIGEAANRIRAWNGRRFMLFHQGGGTKWGISDDEKIEILLKHGIYPHWDQPGRGLGTREGGNTNRSANQLKAHVDAALKSGDWHWTLFHGIGGDWVVQDKQAFITMLDYMESKKDQIWFPTCTQAHKYKMERRQSKTSIISVSAETIEIDLTFNPAGLSAPDAQILDTLHYNYPLTLTTEIHQDWDSCAITQSGKQTIWAANNGIVMYQALPGKGTITISTHH